MNERNNSDVEKPLEINDNEKKTTIEDIKKDILYGLIFLVLGIASIVFGEVLDFGFLVGFGCFVIAFAIVMFVAVYNDKEKMLKEQKEEERKHFIEEYFDFLGKHSAINALKKEADEAWGKCAFNSFLGNRVNLRPRAPQYTRGIIEGSLADNVSVIANEQKKKNYEQQLSDYLQTESENIKFMTEAKIHFDDYYKIVQDLINALKKTPGGEKFISLEKDRMERLKSTLH